MKIETKFNPGDKVFFLVDGQACVPDKQGNSVSSGTVLEVVMEKTGVFYRVESGADVEDFYSDELFISSEEAWIAAEARNPSRRETTNSNCNCDCTKCLRLMMELKEMLLQVMHKEIDDGK